MFWILDDWLGDDLAMKSELEKSYLVDGWDYIAQVGGLPCSLSFLKFMLGTSYALYLMAVDVRRFQNWSCNWDVKNVLDEQPFNVKHVKDLVS